MGRHRVIAWMLLLCFAPLLGAQTFRGTDAHGTPWVVALPKGWKPGDGLVLVQHGYRFERVAEADLGLSAERMLADGFAVAASGYRQTGWAVFDAVEDNLALLTHFREQHGEPGTIVAHGASMGAFIALKLAEDDRIRADIDGVVALCPAVDGVGAWDRAFDLRMAYDALCRDVPGGQLAAGAAPWPWAAGLDVLQETAADTFDLVAMVEALPPVQACLALDRPVAQRSTAALQRIEALQAVAGTRNERMLAVLLNFAYFGLSDLLRAADKLDGANPFFNRAMVRGRGQSDLLYRSGALAEALPPDFDTRVARVMRDDLARAAFHRSSSLDGSASARIVSIHTSGDGIVPARDQRLLAERFEQSQPVIGVVAEAAASHCGFSAAESEAAWSALRLWLQDSTAPAPDVATLQSLCIASGAAPCRFDAAATAAALHEPAALRRPLTDVFARDAQTVGGLWWDPARPAQGLLIEELDDHVGAWRAGEQRASVSWYTWAPAGDPRPGPRWLHGIGRVYENAIVVDPVYEVRGGRFGAALDPAVVKSVPWGRVEMSFAADAATLRYSGPAAYGQGELRLDHLLPAGAGVDSSVAFEPPLQNNFARRGTYFDPLQGAGGWMVNSFESSAHASASLVVWFTWDPDGEPTWIYGLDDDDADGTDIPMQRAVRGGRFEGGHAASDVSMQAWGSLSLQGCDDGNGIERIAWRSPTAGYGEGNVAVGRLTTPRLSHGVLDCP